MLAALLRRFASREAVLATAAQAALTWGANHLSAQIAEQAQRVAELEDELERVTAERDHSLEAVNAWEDEREDLIAAVARREDLLREACRLGDVDLEKLVADEPLPTYPTVEDVAPLKFGLEGELHYRGVEYSHLAQCPAPAGHIGPCLDQEA